MLIRNGLGGACNWALSLPIGQDHEVRRADCVLESPYMPLTITGDIEGNVIDISEALRAKINGRIVLQGRGNHISIADSTFNLGFYFTLGENCRLTIGRNANFLNLVTYQAREAVLEISDNTGFNGLVRLQMHEPSALRIGKDSLLADQVEITTSDMHSIVDVASGARLNPARDIDIGERVWIGQRAIVLKGARIGDGSVIGAAAVVTGEIPENCVAAGNPARIVRRNASWNFKLL